jgi:hypothetical protein
VSVSTLAQSYVLDKCRPLPTLSAGRVPGGASDIGAAVVDPTPGRSADNPAPTQRLTKPRASTTTPSKSAVCFDMV